MTKRLCAAALGARILIVMLLLTTLSAGAALAAAPESKRLGRAKDYIADEQWARAIAELQVVADDPKETRRDEALFWLAHSEHQTGDDGAAIETIARLEKQYPKSPWVRIAGSMRVEIAQRLRRDDLLWLMVTPPASPRALPTPTPAAVGSVPPTARPSRLPAPPAPSPMPPPANVPPAPPGLSGAPPAAAPVPTPGAGRRFHPVAAPEDPSPPQQFWVPGATFATDANVRIEALGGLIESHGDRAIPLLKDIALDEKSPDEARRAVWLLAQSRRPDARSTVFEVARRGAEPVKIAAIREIGHFDGPSVSAE